MHGQALAAAHPTLTPYYSAKANFEEGKASAAAAAAGISVGAFKASLGDDQSISSSSR
jgi:hypothetical protein